MGNRPLSLGTPPIAAHVREPLDPLPSDLGIDCPACEFPRPRPTERHADYSMARQWRPRRERMVDLIDARALRGKYAMSGTAPGVQPSESAADFPGCSSTVRLVDVDPAGNRSDVRRSELEYYVGHL